MKIIPISEDRIDQILEVYRNCEDFLALGPVAQASREMVLGDMAHARETGSIYCGLFEDQEQLAGIVDYLPRLYLKERGAAFIELLMVARNFRGQGLGTMAIQEVERLIWTDPEVQTIDLAVQVNNPGGRRFWEKHGFHLVSGPHDEPDGTTVGYFRKLRRTVI